METNKVNVGSEYYFTTTTDNGELLVQYGELISFLPKYMYLDKYNSKYSRDQEYLFNVKCLCCNTIKKSLHSADFIFANLDDVVDFVKNKDVLFHQSVIIKLSEANTSEFKV